MEFDSEFTGLETALGEGRYAELTAFDIEPLMQVDDYVRDLHGTGVAAEDGSVRIEPDGICRPRPPFAASSDGGGERD